VWVDGLLDVLVRIKVSVKNLDDMSPFIARVTVLKAKLERVRFFKNQILLEMKETQIPAHLERNWLKYGAVAAMLGWGYQSNALEKLSNAFAYVTNSVKEYVITPVENVMKDVFGRGNHNVSNELLVSQEEITIAQNTIAKFLAELVSSGDITVEQEKMMLSTIESGKSESLYALMNELWDKGLFYKSKFLTSSLLWGEFKFLMTGKRLQEKLANIENQYIGIGKIAVLTPTLLSSWLAYRSYTALTEKDYAPIRRALIDINSLLVDATRSLDDEQYGKMLYLIYDLKKRAAVDVPVTDRVDFINDLHRIESKEFNVAAKRAIVDDMFRKYSFLKLS
jgi:hypothetical protein